MSKQKDVQDPGRWHSQANGIEHLAQSRLWHSNDSTAQAHSYMSHIPTTTAPRHVSGCCGVFVILWSGEASLVPAFRAIARESVRRFSKDAQRLPTTSGAVRIGTPRSHQSRHFTISGTRRGFVCLLLFSSPFYLTSFSFVLIWPRFLEVFHQQVCQIGMQSGQSSGRCQRKNGYDWQQTEMIYSIFHRMLWTDLIAGS